MKPLRKFNKLFNSITTKVEINDKLYEVKEVHASRQWIKVHGLNGSFQRGHINKFTNKEA